MTIDTNSGTIITETDAIAYTHAHQTLFPRAIKAFFAGKNKLNLILDQEDCIGIRIYDGYDAEGEIANRVLVGVDAMGEDMVSGIILEDLIPCPKACSNTTSLIKV